MRGLLFEGAPCVIRLVKCFPALKSWAVRLAGRRGFRKAAVATAQDRSADIDGLEEWSRLSLGEGGHSLIRISAGRAGSDVPTGRRLIDLVKTVGKRPVPPNPQTILETIHHRTPS